MTSGPVAQGSPARERYPQWGEWTAASLLAVKGDQRISVVIPARDEQATVGGIVAAVRRDLVEAVPLVDELVVIDSDSVDDTYAVSLAAGAVVHRAGEIRPELGTRQGKGEALWKAQFVTTGGIVVHLDSDLVDWGTHFVTGLLGPLLTDPAVSLVKAIYDRPLLDATGHEVETGGRVTELVARPLLALHWPALAGVVQPLSGEWAIRRPLLEQLSMPVGYGVEIAALVDAARLGGPDAVAQVDLGRRTHRHHRHDTLGPMAVQVLAACEARLSDRAGSAAVHTVTLRQFDRLATGFTPRETAVDVRERPPAINVQGYAAFGVPS
ncbi:MAG: glucosyl-3-phosphoglycerate synthase [Nostocoides sp.]